MNYATSIPVPGNIFRLGALDPLQVRQPKLDYNHPPANFRPKKNKKKGKK
jgi:hypothetical protein